MGYGLRDIVDRRDWEMNRQHLIRREGLGLDGRPERPEKSDYMRALDVLVSFQIDQKKSTDPHQSSEKPVCRRRME